MLVLGFVASDVDSDALKENSSWAAFELLLLRQAY